MHNACGHRAAELALFISRHMFQAGPNQLELKRERTAMPKEKEQPTPKPKWKSPKTPKNVLIADWWDRSPCFWICDLTKLDESDSIQAEYKKTVMSAISDMHSHNSDGNQWLCAGDGSVPEDCDWTCGRPDEVDHAVVLPPCTIDAYVVLYYPS